MESNFVQVGSLKIHYLEKNKDGKSIIFFIHGNSGSAHTWDKQLSNNLFSEYRLIAFDLPGHGRSSHSDNPDDDYSPIGTAKILSEVIQKLAGLQPYLLIGFSYGTNLIAEMLNYGLTPNGIVLIASCVLGNGYGMEKVFLQNEVPAITFYNEVDQTLVAKWFETKIIAPTNQILMTLAGDYLGVSPLFKPSLFKTAGEGKISDEIGILQRYDVPVCVVFGIEDDIVNINYLDAHPFEVWHNKIYKLPGAGHWISIDRPDILNELLVEYAEEVLNQSMFNTVVN